MNQNCVILEFSLAVSMNGNTKNSQIKYCPCPKFVFIKLKKKKNYCNIF